MYHIIESAIVSKDGDWSVVGDARVFSRSRPRPILGFFGFPLSVRALDDERLVELAIVGTTEEEEPDELDEIDESLCFRGAAAEKRNSSTCLLSLPMTEIAVGSSSSSPSAAMRRRLMDSGEETRTGFKRGEGQVEDGW
jgi:hypothetical protein